MARQTPARFIGLGFGFVWIVAVIGSATSPAAADRIDFVKDIQPIFQKSCYRCHGPKLQMSGLRLDAKKPALAGGQSGKAIQPGSASESPLYKRIAGIGEQPRMPMEGDPLAAAEIELVRSWIDQGAEWPDGANGDVTEVKKKHWAFIAPKRPALPQVKNSHWPPNPIDPFVLARLEKEGLKPSPEADRVTLLRRLSLDLIGLPPTIEEVDAFLADRVPTPTKSRSSGCWPRRTTASAGDGTGSMRPATPIPTASKKTSRAASGSIATGSSTRSIAILPYDQFVIEQIAGDLLPNATQDQSVATGFLRNSMINEEGGVDPEQFRMEAMFDRMDAIGKSDPRLTIQCAQCHNHKYDPLTQEEYYRMFAFLNNSHEAQCRGLHAGGADEARRNLPQHSRDRRRPAAPHARLAGADGGVGRQASTQISRNGPSCSPTVDDISTGGQKYLPMKDGSLLAQGYAPTKHRVKIDGQDGRCRTSRRSGWNC